MLTQTHTDPTTPTTSPQETKPDAAAQWRDVIQRLQAYKLECDQLDEEEMKRRRHQEVEAALDELASTCRRLDREAAAKPTKKR